MRWTLYRLNGRTGEKKQFWASNLSAPTGKIIGGFHGVSGRYQLEWDVPPEAACLNALGPRVLIFFTSADSYQEINGWLDYLCLFFGGVGGMLVLRGMGRLLWGRLVGTRALRMLPELAPRNVLPLRPSDRAGQMTPMTHLSNFAVGWTGLLGVLLFIQMIITTPTFHGRGLFVKIHEQSAVVGQKSPWPQTMSVYVDADNRFYVNSYPVASEALRAKLMDELKKQMVWAVYFEADKNSTFAKAAYAMSVIQGVGAKVIWITPQVREELNREGTRDLTPADQASSQHQ